MMDRRQAGHREWRQARFHESVAVRLLKIRTDEWGITKIPSEADRLKALRAFSAARKWRFAAYLEGYEPRKNNRGRTESGSEFERWWSKLPEPDKQKVIERRWDHAEKLKNKNNKLYTRGFDMSAAFERRRRRNEQEG